jgi:hypothetical protein
VRLTEYAVSQNGFTSFIPIDAIDPLYREVRLTEYAVSQNGFTSYILIDAIDPLYRDFDLQLSHRCISLSVSKNAALTDQHVEQSSSAI